MSGTRDRGFALLIVLWALVPLALLFLVLAVTARSDSQGAAALRSAAVLEAAADGAISTAIFDELASGGQASGARRMRFAGADIAVSTVRLSARVNPNAASAELLRALMVRLGADDARARLVAAAMVDWRTPGQRASVNGAKASEYKAAGLDYGPPGAPFESLDELGLVLGMTPALLNALTPYLSLYAYGDPDPLLAAPPLRQALLDIGARGGGALETRVVEITASASGAGPAQTTRRATILFGPSASGRGWRVLAWDTVFGR